MTECSENDNNKSGSQIDLVDSETISETTNTNTTKEDKEKEEAEGKSKNARKKVSPKVFLQKKAASALEKLKKSNQSGPTHDEPVSSRTRSGLQPVAARTRTKSKLMKKK